MKQTKIIMGMPITVEINDQVNSEDIFTNVFNYFTQIDNRFSTYKLDSEISQINRGLPRNKWSPEMKHVMDLCHQTQIETGGYFNIESDGKLDPSGIVKGWAIKKAAETISSKGYKNFYVEAGGDIQFQGKNSANRPWVVGIRNPLNRYENVKILTVGHNQGVATSGTYIRGDHIYNPLKNNQVITDLASITVIGPDIYNADRLATSAFAMGSDAASFIESLNGYEAYVIDKNMVATMTSGLERFVI